MEDLEEFRDLIPLVIDEDAFSSDDNSKNQFNAVDQEISEIKEEFSHYLHKIECLFNSALDRKRKPRMGNTKFPTGSKPVLLESNFYLNCWDISDHQPKRKKRDDNCINVNNKFCDLFDTRLHTPWFGTDNILDVGRITETDVVDEEMGLPVQTDSVSEEMWDDEEDLYSDLLSAEDFTTGCETTSPENKATTCNDVLNDCNDSLLADGSKISESSTSSLFLSKESDIPDHTVFLDKRVLNINEDILIGDCSDLKTKADLANEEVNVPDDKDHLINEVLNSDEDLYSDMFIGSCSDHKDLNTDSDSMNEEMNAPDDKDSFINEVPNSDEDLYSDMFNGGCSDQKDLNADRNNKEMNVPDDKDLLEERRSLLSDQQTVDDSAHCDEKTKTEVLNREVEAHESVKNQELDDDDDLYVDMCCEDSANGDVRPPASSGEAFSAKKVFDNASFDLYSDILTDELTEKKSHVDELAKSCEAFKNESVKLKEQLRAILQQNVSLKKNICALFKTAKLEVQRKDAEIGGLRARLDDLLFRRSKPRSFEGKHCSSLRDGPPEFDADDRKRINVVSPLRVVDVKRFSSETAPCHRTLSSVSKEGIAVQDTSKALKPPSSCQRKSPTKENRVPHFSLSRYCTKERTRNLNVFKRPNAVGKSQKSVPPLKERNGNFLQDRHKRRLSGERIRNEKIDK